MYPPAALKIRSQKDKFILCGLMRYAYMAGTRMLLFMKLNYNLLLLLSCAIDYNIRYVLMCA